MEKFLRRLGVPDKCLELAKQVIAACEECNDRAPIATKLKYRAELAGSFGEVMVRDLFFISGKTFLLMVDEAIRWKLAEVLPKKDAFHIAQAMLRTWLRYFGPPTCIKFDREGGVRSDDFAAVCDRYSIHRQLGGSDDSGKHTATGLAERHIGLIKTSCKPYP